MWQQLAGFETKKIQTKSSPEQSTIPISENINVNPKIDLNPIEQENDNMSVYPEPDQESEVDIPEDNDGCES
jgi:hypothetical protein